MSWLLEASGHGSVAALLAERGDLVAQYRAFLEALWREGSVPVRMLHLCRLRIATIHGDLDSWQPVPLPALDPPLDAATLKVLEQGLDGTETTLFSAAEQAALAVAELMPHGQHQISDAQVARLQSELGNQGAIALLTALAFFDVNARLSLSLGLPSDQPGQMPRNTGA